MIRISENAFLLEGIRSSDVYALALESGVVLIDSGMPGAETQIAAQLESAGYGLSDLRAVVLTHSHFDHTGSAAALASLSGAEVLAHRSDVRYIEGVAPLPYGSWLQRAAMSIAGEILGERITCKVTRALEDGEVLEALGGLEVVHTPGHTPGSICLYWPAGQVLFSGDLLVHSRRFSSRLGVRFSIPQFSVDPEGARRSAQRLLELPVEVLCCGHGKPVTEGARSHIRALVDRSPERFLEGV